ncbi:MAG: hypothetical protein G01um101448_868 [Parcubacteria group bacterium Gr01-1014_48]|nr:MAG: hypothetical protein Greene041614_1188 [Parcubacteria group bacterium Greene0416_14]TSC72967.1 MAG: hypothetical protein G01um101448_868 [Parcubacteria group bacterium Gr01-1014_48]TSC99685.1 MAG: hypothetical protein Greene101415_1126 [Parcubacteria group bacterium Greene1014_15]TSD06916.1 MAG: hypothetical protein Greene07144_1065 [Parcubacteria group bacterium Greene0714_4]
MIKMVFIFFLTVLVGLALVVIVQNESKGRNASEQLAQAVEKCNTAPINHKFSCYRAAIQKSYRKTQGALANFLESIETNNNLVFQQEQSLSNDPSYAIFGTNCHTFYHALGDFIATEEAAPLKNQVGLCSTSCTGGCYMGLYKRTALENQFATNTLESLFPLCPGASKHQCAHEIGHLLHDKYVSAILGIIDEISEQEYGLLPKKKLQYTLYAEPNLAQPFADCKTLVPETELAYCYTGVGHNLFLFAQFESNGYEKAFADCALPVQETRENCENFLVYRIGINDAGVKFLSGDSATGNRVCDNIATLASTGTVLSHCYRGIGAGIGLFLESEFAHQSVTGVSRSKIKGIVSRYIDLCKNIKEKYAEECYKGILGTRVKKMYLDLGLKKTAIEELLEKVEDGFEAVG